MARHDGMAMRKKLGADKIAEPKEDWATSSAFMVQEPPKEPIRSEGRFDPVNNGHMSEKRPKQTTGKTNRFSHSPKMNRNREFNQLPVAQFGGFWGYWCQLRDVTQPRDQADAIPGADGKLGHGHWLSRLGQMKTQSFQ